MRILQVIDSLHLGGAERLLVDSIPYIVERGFTVDIVLLNGDMTAFFKELKDKDCCNIFSLGNKYYDLSYFLKLYKLINNYDIIHVHLFPAQYYIAILKMLRLTNRKLVFTEHSTSNRRLKNSFFRVIERQIYKQYDNVVCISMQVKEALLINRIVSETKLTVIENGVNINKIIRTPIYDREEFGFGSEDIILLMVAGFRREKDQDTLIRGLNDLSGEYKLLLVGDGERREVLEELVEELSLRARVVFLGIRSDVYSLMKMCDIVVLSSHWEGFGLVAVEAMAAGIPVIASNVDGLGQVVDGGGVLFERGNKEDLVEKINTLKNRQYYEEVSCNCRVKAETYNIVKMVDKLTRLYEKK